MNISKTEIENFSGMSLKDQVMTLRAKTGCGMMDCRKAIQYYPEFDWAVAYLMYRGLAVNLRGTVDDKVKHFHDRLNLTDE